MIALGFLGSLLLLAWCLYWLHFCTVLALDRDNPRWWRRINAGLAVCQAIAVGIFGAWCYTLAGML